MCASILIRKSDFRQVGEMQPFLKQLNETQGFQQLSSGIRVYNSFLQREILVFGVFNSWLGDSPERCSVGAFKNPTPMSQKGCHFCLQDADVWHLMLAGEVHSSYTPDEFQAEVKRLPEPGADMDHSNKFLADQLDVHGRSALNDFPHVRATR